MKPAAAILRDKGYATVFSAVRNAARWASCSAPMPVRLAWSGSSAARIAGPARQEDFDGYWASGTNRSCDHGRRAFQTPNPSSPRSHPLVAPSGSSYRPIRKHARRLHQIHKGVAYDDSIPPLSNVSAAKSVPRTVFVRGRSCIVRKIRTVTRTYPRGNYHIIGFMYARRRCGRGRRRSSFDIMPTVLSRGQ